MPYILKSAIVKVTLVKERKSDYFWDDGYNFFTRLFSLPPDEPKYIHPKVFYSDIPLKDFDKHTHLFEKEPTKGLWYKPYAKIRLADGSESYYYFLSDHNMNVWAEEKFSNVDYLYHE